MCGVGNDKMHDESQGMKGFTVRQRTIIGKTYNYFAEVQRVSCPWLLEFVELRDDQEKPYRSA